MSSESISGGSEASSFQKMTAKMRRLTTRQLLGALYEESIEGPLPSAPHPGRVSSEYNDDRVRESLRFADATIRNPIRNLSPIGIQAVRLYKETCAKNLSLQATPDINEEEVGKAKREYVTAMRIMEKSFHYNLCFETTNTTTAQAFQDELVRLMRTQFYARYGEYFAELCKELKREAEKKKVEGWERLHKSFWTEIWKMIESEKGSWAAYMGGDMNAFKECETHNAIRRTCLKIGLDMPDALSAIKHYATRNELVHANLLQLIKDGRLDDLKNILYADFCDIPKVTDLTEDGCGTLLQFVLKTLINKWFSFAEKDADNTQMWQAKSRLHDLHSQLEGAEDRATEINKKVAKDMMAAMKRMQRDEQRDKDLKELIETGGLTIQDGQLKKRISKSQLATETELARRMQKSWEALMKIAGNLRKMRDKHLEDFKFLTGGPQLVVDPALNDDDDDD